MSDLKLDVDQAGELKAAFRRSDWTNEEIKKLCEGNILAEVRQVIEGNAEIKTLEHVIDCDANPFVPNNWTIEEHQKSGMFKWDPAQVKLYLSESQSKGKAIGGHDLRKDLRGKPVMNACIRDYLLAHPELIPDSWKGKYIFFWGTIYRDSDGDLCVRDLYLGGDRWQWGCYWLEGDWTDRSPAALRASLPAEASA